MRFARRDGGVIEFGAQAVDTLMSFRQLSNDATEAGGVLLGRFILDSRDIVVDEATTPGPLDRRTRYGFRRSRKSTQPRVEQAWLQTSATRNYLGDWHTHPE